MLCIDWKFVPFPCSCICFLISDTSQCVIKPDLIHLTFSYSCMFMTESDQPKQLKLDEHGAWSSGQVKLHNIRFTSTQMTATCSGGSRISSTRIANSKGKDDNLLFWPISPENCMKMKIIGLRVWDSRPCPSPLNPTVTSATKIGNISQIWNPVVIKLSNDWKTPSMYGCYSCRFHHHSTHFSCVALIKWLNFLLLIGTFRTQLSASGKSTSAGSEKSLYHFCCGML